MEGKIIKIISNDFTVDSNGSKYICKARGKFRKQGIVPLVGDQVLFDEQNNYILEIKKRKNFLNRPPIANIDQAIIVTSVKEPDFSANLLDKLLTIIQNHQIKPIICFTKLDLIQNKTQINKIINYYSSIYDVYCNTEIEKLKKIFANKISVLTGQSGAGKSTLLNQLDTNLNLKTDEISHALNRGKHTTRHVELLYISAGLVADTPGFSSLDLNSISKENIRDSFPEFKQYPCLYRNCMHDKEQNCEVKKHIGTTILQSRYDNYIKFIKR